MKKNYLLGCILVALFSVIVSCNQEDQIIPESKSTTLEPDFFKNDGSMDESELEEEAPVELNTKTYSYYNYTLLKPVDVAQEKIDAVCGESKTMPLLVGSRKKKVGKVEVSNDDENLYLTFTANQYKYMKKVYLYIGDKGSIPLYSNGYPNLRKFNFKAFPYYYGGTKKATYVIPLSSIDVDCFEIVAYSKIYDRYSRCYYSSFAYNKSLTQTYGYSYNSGCYYYNDWVRSFEYCKKSCEDNCIKVFGIKHLPEYRSCMDLNINGNTILGWSSRIRYSWLLDMAAINHYEELPIYINSSGCDLSDVTEIGRMEVTAGDNGTGVQVAYFIYPYDYSDYEIYEVDLYVGTEENPYKTDGTLKDNINEDNFHRQTFDTPVKRTDPVVLPWTGDESSELYIIPYAKVCKIK